MSRTKEQFLETQNKKIPCSYCKKTFHVFEMNSIPHFEGDFENTERHLCDECADKMEKYLI